MRFTARARRATRFLSLLALVGCATESGPRPSEVDVQFAQTDFIHSQLGPDGVVHCARLSALRCQVSDGDAPTASCSYAEGDGPLPRLRIKMRWDGDFWQWVSGDTPTCSVMLFEEPPSSAP